MVRDAIVCKKGKKYNEASGKKGIKTLKKPQDANFNITAAKIIDPAKGASACALNNQIWNGNKGVLMAKLKKKAQG